MPAEPPPVTASIADVPAMTAETQSPPGPGPASSGAAGRIAGLHPGWSASVMGTGILATATAANPGGLTALVEVSRVLGAVIAVAALVLGAVMVTVSAVRWTRFRQAATADLRHPVLGALHATLPGALLVLAVMVAAVGPGLVPDALTTALVAILGTVGAVLALVLSVAFVTTLFVGAAPPSSVNGGWFIPPVVTVIIAMAMAPLASRAAPPTGRLLLALGYAALGMGLVLFLLVLGLYFDRLVLHPVPPAPLVPALWIGLGPVGVGALALLALAGAGQAIFGAAGPGVMVGSLVGATGLWGFGLWWLAVVVALTVRQVRRAPIPFHLGWWAFTFPLGAFTVATLRLARAWDVAAIEGLAVLLYLALVGFWVLVVVRTVGGVRSGLVWQR